MFRRLQKRENNKTDQQTDSRANEGTGEPRLPSPVLDAGEGPSKRHETAEDIFKLATGAQRRSSPKQLPLSATDLFKSADAGHQILKSRQTSVSVNRAFIDRQDNASRVSPIESAQVSPGVQPPRGNKRKRKSVTPTPDDSLFCTEISDFEDDGRPAKQLRRELNIFTSPERPRIALGSIYSSTHSTQDSSESEFETDQRPFRRRRIAPARPPPTRLTRPERAPAAVRGSGRPATVNGSETDSDSSVSRAIRPSEDTNVPKFVPSQRRKRWSEREIKALEKYIKTHGTQFSRIKAEDNGNGQLLQRRTQLNLKDKARDLAFMYWK